MSSPLFGARSPRVAPPSSPAPPLHNADLDVPELITRNAPTASRASVLPVNAAPAHRGGRHHYGQAGPLALSEMLPGRPAPFDRLSADAGARVPHRTPVAEGFGAVEAQIDALYGADPGDDEEDDNFDDLDEDDDDEDDEDDFDGEDDDDDDFDDAA